jgi:hypothetical protein
MNVLCQSLASGVVDQSSEKQIPSPLPGWGFLVLPLAGYPRLAPR